MIHQINFYQGPSKTSKPLFGAVYIVKATLGVLGVLIVFSAYQGWQIDTVQHNLNRSRDHLQELSAEMESLKVKYPKLPVDHALQKKLEATTRSVATIQHVIDYLTDSQADRARGFSSYFEGLARQPIANVWFSNVTVADGGLKVKLSGSTLQPAQIPRLLQSLGAESAFQGKLFNSLVMKKPENGLDQVNFSIETKAPKSSGPDGV